MKPCGVKCCKADCNSNLDITFHSFPEDENLRALWFNRIGIENLYPGYLQVCSVHFENKWIINKKGSVRLRTNAVPTLFLCTRKSEESMRDQKCSVPLCRNESNNLSKSKDITFHMFPQELQLRLRWLNALGLEGSLKQGESYANSVVCSEHFANEDLYTGENGSRMIHTGAVPVIIQDTLEEIEDPEPEIKKTLPICRICLDIDTKLLSMDRYKLNETYQNLTGFTMFKDSRVSQTVCFECAQRLVNFDKFREKSLRADILLSTVLKKQESSIKQHITNLDRQNFKLTSNLITTVFKNDHCDLVIQENNEIDQNIELDNAREDNTPIEVVKNEENKQFDNAHELHTNIKTEEPIVLRNFPLHNNEIINTNQHKEFKILRNLTEHKNEISNNLNVHREINNRVILKPNKRVEVDYVPIIYDVVLNDKFKIIKKEDLIHKEIVVSKDNNENQFIKTELNQVDIEPDEQIIEYDYNDNESIEETVITEDYVEASEVQEYEVTPKLIEIEVDTTNKKKNNQKVITKSNDEFENSVDTNWNNEDEDVPLESGNSVNSGVKKRKKFKKRSLVPDGLNDVIFTIKSLDLDEQIAEVKNRLTTISKNADIVCKYCYRGFMDESTHSRHMTRHTSEYGDYACCVCKLRFRTVRMMETHRALRHATKYICNFCNFSTCCSEPARQHGLKHKGIMYSCPKCPEEFLRYTVLMDHILLEHTPESICPMCGLKFSNFEEMYQHMAVKHKSENEVTENGPLCEVCDMYFGSDFAYAQHLAVSLRHNSEFVAQHLLAKNQQQEELQTTENETPKKKGEGRGIGPMACEQCGQQLSSLRKYHAHFRRYHPDKTRTFYPTMTTRVMCELCGRFFRAQWHYVEHMRMHKNERPYKCEHCGKSFMKKHLLRNHRFMHSDPRPDIRCKLCNRLFANRSNLHRHMACHTGEKRFKCDLCGRRYRSKGEQQSHYDHVHLRKPWPKRIRKRDREIRDTASVVYVKSASDEDTAQTVIEEECVEEMEIEY